MENILEELKKEFLKAKEAFEKKIEQNIDASFEHQDKILSIPK